MTQDEIIAMARKAGFVISAKFGPIVDVVAIGRELERFAALVAAKEREACAQSLENLVADHVTGTRKSTNKQDWCAADDRSCEYVDAWSVSIEAIRARSTT